MADAERGVGAAESNQPCQSACLNQWSADLEDGATMYVCEGQDLTLPWSITPDTGEQIIDIRWLFDGHSEQMIAFYANNIFLPTPSYSECVQHVANGALVLSHVTQKDVGKYTIEINMADGSGAHVTHRRTAAVHVASASIARTDATLKVIQQSTAVYSNVTHQYHVRLTCTSHGHPPPVVLWTTPSQEQLPSSKKDGDTFSLLLPNPVSGGNYSCRLPPDSPAATCLPKDDPVLEGATVFVDETQARFTLLEAELTAFRQENSELKTEITDLKTEHSELRQHMQVQEELRSKQVMFHARVLQLTEIQVPSGSRMIFRAVFINQGNAYSSTTGVFTAPYDGTYFFTATITYAMRPHSNPIAGGILLMVDGTSVALISIKKVDMVETGTCSYTAHLTTGESVWLETLEHFDFAAHETFFSGYLINPD